MDCDLPLNSELHIGIVFTKRNADDIKSLFAFGYNILNAPHQGGVCILSLPYGTYQIMSQLCITLETVTIELHARRKVNDTWSAWKLIG